MVKVQWVCLQKNVGLLQTQGIQPRIGDLEAVQNKRPDWLKKAVGKKNVVQHSGHKWFSVVAPGIKVDS